MYRSDLFNETSPKCKNANNIVISQWPLFVQWWHAHTGLIMCIINEFVLTIKELLPIYHMTEKRDVRLHMHTNIKDF